MGISNTLLDLFESFSWKKIQKAVLNSQTSERLPIKTGVPQGSTFGPLLSLTYTCHLISYPLLNYLQIIHHYFPLSMILRQQYKN